MSAVLPILTVAVLVFLAKSEAESKLSFPIMESAISLEVAIWEFSTAKLVTASAFMDTLPADLIVPSTLIVASFVVTLSNFVSESSSELLLPLELLSPLELL